MNAFPSLQAILDVDAAERAGWAPLDLTREFLEGGATFLQVRAKHLPSGRLLDLCDAVVALATERGARVIINDRVDVARMCGAAGVHVGQDDLPPDAARALLGPDAIVGFSTHTVEQVEAALLTQATYVAVGPVFGTHTKDTGYTAVGLNLVADAARLCRDRPIVAIGGITVDTAPQVLRAGATTVAVIGDLLVGGSPAVRVARYNRLASARRL